MQAFKPCQEHNKQAVKYSKFNFEAEPAPMNFISMDLIGEFHPPSSKGNRYALTVICMFTGYTFCIPIPNKKAETVLKVYMDHVYCKHGGSLMILSNNGTEFKNKLMEEVSKELGVEYKVYSPPYRPQSNGRIESFHYFLKAYIAKHINPQLEWDDVVPLARAAYNFLPNEHSRESPFFLMYGRDPLLPLTKLLQPKVRYLGNDENILSLEASKNIYLNSPGGYRKTFLIETLLSTVRGMGKIALAVASSGIAAELLQGGRTAHSCFKIPIPVNETSICSISLQSDDAKLIQQTSLIIWDEIMMSNVDQVLWIDPSETYGKSANHLVVLWWYLEEIHDKFYQW